MNKLFGKIEYPTTRPLVPIMPDGVPLVTTDDDIEKYYTWSNK